jgi:hypothetical protein
LKRKNARVELSSLRFKSARTKRPGRTRMMALLKEKKEVEERAEPRTVNWTHYRLIYL